MEFKMRYMLPLTAILILILIVSTADSAGLVTEDVYCCSPNYTCTFVEYGNRRIKQDKVHAVVWLAVGASYQDCLQICLSYQNFTCLSASYYNITGECQLSMNNLQSAQTSLEPSATGWYYYDLDRDTCGPISCTVPTVPNANMSEPAGSTLLCCDSSFSVSCLLGYTLSGAGTLECVDQETFNSPTPSCVPVVCSTSLSFPNSAANIVPPYEYLDSISYSCDAGYFKSTNENLVCDSTGTISGTGPVCSEITCSPYITPNGQLTGNDTIYSYSQTAPLTCDLGYVLSGNGQLICEGTTQPGTWKTVGGGALPTCTVIECTSSVPSVSDSTITTSAPYFLSDPLTYQCDTGFNMTGSSTIYCGPDGEFNASAPVCSPNYCSDPDGVYPNVVISSSSPYIYLDFVTAACEVGYGLTTPSILICNEYGQWEGTAPVCTRIYCSAPAVTNGQVVESGPYIHGYTISFACDYGYELSSTSNLVCDTTTGVGVWTGTQPICTRVECAFIPATSSSVSPPGPYYYQDSVVYTCDIGYNMTAGTDTLTCQGDTNWDVSPPICTLNKCPDIAVTEGVLGFSGGYVYSDVPALTCAVGYHTISQSTLQCNQWGIWVGDALVCKRTECTAPIIFNAQLSPPPPYYNGDKLIVKCDTGYTVATGDTTLTCDASVSPGVWVGNLPVCSPIQCLAKNILYGGYDGYPQTVFFYNDVIDYYCDEGHFLSGSKTLTCKSSGYWNYPEPNCQPYRCPSEEVKDGTIASVGPYLWHDVITYRCNIGFNMTGVNMRQCGPTGQWLSPAPSCQPIECTLSSDGLVAESSGPYYYGDRVDVKCKQSTHYLTGWSFLICGSNGVWDRSYPSCQVVTCDPPSVNNATILGGGMKQYLAFETVQMQCANGLMAVGSTQLTCEKTDTGQGKWAPELQCSAPSSELLSQFEDKDAWLNIFLPLLAAALIAAGLTACCCWYFCCGARRRRRRVDDEHEKDCKCKDCHEEDNSHIEHVNITLVKTPIPSVLPPPAPSAAVWSEAGFHACSRSNSCTAVGHHDLRRASCQATQCHSGGCSRPPTQRHYHHSHDHSHRFNHGHRHSHFI